MDDGFTHLGPGGRPGMVDVGGKERTRREAVARARVRLPEEVLAALDGTEIRAPKGPVLQTAILAGTMAVKKTWDLIPLCHPLPLDRISLDAEVVGQCVEIECTVAVEARTGVEMEALTGASIAALAVYDMCKALSHEIVVEDLRLVSKAGGKRDFGPGKGDA